MKSCNLYARPAPFYILVCLVGMIALLYIIKDYKSTPTFLKTPMSGQTEMKEINSAAPVVRVQEAGQTGLAPCGAVCSYGGVPHQRPTYPFIEKQIDCSNIMKRMAWTGHKIVYPPPKQPPAHQFKDFTQNGECPLGPQYYLNDVNTSSLSVNGFYEKDIMQFVANVNAGKTDSFYGDGIIVSQTVKKYKQYVNGMKGYVVGTVKPWVEAALLAHGASHVTTIEYRDFPLKHPNISLVNPYKFAEMYAQRKTELFDFGTSFSSLEHAGLGRYGDPLNPFGDMEAMAQAYCITKPGGYYFLGVPGAASCQIIWNAHRLYSNLRLKHLTANWEVVDIIHGSIHVLVVLRKPYF